jgi:hypothetical protein
VVLHINAVDVRHRTIKEARVADDWVRVGPYKQIFLLVTTNITERNDIFIECLEPRLEVLDCRQFLSPCHQGLINGIKRELFSHAFKNHWGRLRVFNPKVGH